MEINVAESLVARWGVYTLTLLALSVTPGPMNLFALYDGMQYGWRVTQWAVLGGIVGVMVILSASFFGISAIISGNAFLEQALRIVGIAYLIYVALKIVFSGKRDSSLSPQIGQVKFAPKSTSYFGHFRDMFLLALLSPGDLIFFGSFFPPLINLNQSLLLQFGVFAGTYIVIDYVVMSSHAFLGSFILRFLTPTRLKVIKVSSGVALLVMAALLIAINYS